MLTEIKKRLLENPQYIASILEHYKFSKVTLRTDEIRCAFDDEHNPSSIRIKLKDNDALFVTDFGRNQNYDLFTYIIKNRNTNFKDVIAYVNKLLNIDPFYFDFEQHTAFDGFYEKVHLKKTNPEVQKTYPDSMLKNYKACPNMRFLKDNIGIKSQNKFHIGFDIESQRITIPIYNSYGELIGIKGRANWEVNENDIKYYYLVPCRVSYTLYGYSINYEYLTNTTVFIVESEKAVMQADTCNRHNFVALSGNSLTDYQCRLLMELNPKRIIFMLDEGLDLNITKKNILKLTSYTRMSEVQIGYWDYRISKNIPPKSNPCDLGYKRLNEIIKNDIVYV